MLVVDGAPVSGDSGALPITIAESAFHENHPGQPVASLENVFWKGHGFEGFIMIIDNIAG